MKATEEVLTKHVTSLPCEVLVELRVTVMASS